MEDLGLSRLSYGSIQELILFSQPGLVTVRPAPIGRVLLDKGFDATLFKIRAWTVGYIMHGMLSKTSLVEIIELIKPSFNQGPSIVESAKMSLRGSKSCHITSSPLHQRPDRYNTMTVNGVRSIHQIFGASKSP
jgi:hypothetical protein